MKKSIEEVYQKKTQLQHILLRPDTYVGSTQITRSNLWVINEAQEMQKYQVQYVPALYKIFDQVLVNAADNYQRDSTMTTIKVIIDAENGFLQVWNNGQGIPVQVHKQHQIYVPQLIFGHLLTGSNYDDNQKKVVGGRNGYGAKLANIFSTKFSVEAGDNKRGRKFFMEWSKNMAQHGPAKISKYSGPDYTCVRFYPDFKLFKLEGLLKMLPLLKKRVYDIAGIFGGKLKVFYNSKQIKIKSFQQYVKLYVKQANLHRQKPLQGGRWDVLVAFSEGQFNQVSFVNAICTTRGGTHINYLLDQIVSRIQDTIHKKSKDLVVKPHQIKQHLWLFVNCLIQNPSFDSQTKQTLVTKAAKFGSQPQLSDKFIKNILNSGLVQQIINEAKARQLNKMSKNTAGGKKTKVSGIAKLDDANQAGSRNSQKCTLILTQGDSAKGLAMAGLQVIGRDHYGVFPLKGKLLNVRDATNKQIMQNLQIQNVIKIMGLQIGKQYQDRKSLRYGSIMIMTDQDTDGSHIKGLILNFIHSFWPSLVRINGFLKQFITPILKASKGGQVVSFYSIQDFKRWADIRNIKGWHIKYYKGLGTSTDKQAQQYFQVLQQNRLQFQYVNNQDDQAVDLVFNKKKADARKRWLQSYDMEKNVDYRIKKLRYKNFINQEFIHFSIADNLRSIPSLIDGLKPGQRKIIYSCFKRNLRQQIKVAQLSGYVAQHSAYHHGEVSLAQTIVGMAQNFVGSNNVHLLQPIGQFGSRNQGGKQHASARYIFTNLSKITRYLFPQPDDHSLNYMEDDGQLVQPLWYIPILPLALINGGQGIGSGWSTFVPCYNPRDLAKWILNKIQGIPNQPLVPWYKGFQGQIKEGGKGCTCTGIVTVKQQDTIQITQLPIKKWTKDYKMFLEKLAQQENPQVVDIRQYHTKNRVHFQVDLAQGLVDKWGSSIIKNLKLSSSMPLTNCVLFDKDMKLKRYGAVQQIMQQFYNLRLQFYEKRKQYMLSKIQRQLHILKNKSRFITEVISQKLIIRNAKKKKLCQLLYQKGYTKFSQLPQIKSTKAISKIIPKTTQQGQEQEQKPKNKKNKKQNQVNQKQPPKQQGNQLDPTTKEYDYLLRMPLWSLTQQQVQKLINQFNNKHSQKRIIQKTTIQIMWKEDIKQFLQVLQDIWEQQEQQRLNAYSKSKNAKNGKRKQNKKTKKQRKRSQSSQIDSDKQSRKSDNSKKKRGGGRKGKKKQKDSDNHKTSDDQVPISKKDINNLMKDINDKKRKLDFDIKVDGSIQPIVEQNRQDESMKPTKRALLRKYIIDE